MYYASIASLVIIMNIQLQTSNMKLITLHVPQKFIEALDELVARGWYPNRSEAIRVAIRDFLREMKKFLEMDRTRNPSRGIQKS